jgi:hypothetical protein
MADEPMALPTLLSHALVAMTIGIDNELEARMPHTTTQGSKRGVPRAGPWLVSWSVWANLLRFVPPDGIPLEDLESRPGVKPGVLRGKNPGVVRWGYVTVEGRLVRPTTALSRAASDVFPMLPSIVEQRWVDHLGATTVDDLRQALSALLQQVDVLLPRYLPEADQLMWTRWDRNEPRVEPVSDLRLIDMLAQALLLYAVDHERAAAVPLTMAANLLRVIDDGGTPARELPRRSGVSKEALAFLTGSRQVPRLTVETEPKVLTLTPEGARAKAEYLTLPATIERTWAERFGRDVTRGLRTALERVVVAPTLDHSPLAQLIEPPPDGWRSWMKRPETLPHFPMILHRGGYPDGA